MCQRRAAVGGKSRLHNREEVCHTPGKRRGQRMTDKRTYVPFTTAAQRRLLFTTWEATGDVAEACRRAHVGRRTFYYWKPRFLAGGYAALEQFASRAPVHP